MPAPIGDGFGVKVLVELRAGDHDIRPGVHKPHAVFQVIFIHPVVRVDAHEILGVGVYDFLKIHVGYLLIACAIFRNDPRVRLGVLCDDLTGSVMGAVVSDPQLKIPVGLIQDALQRPFQVLFVVVGLHVNAYASHRVPPKR